MNRPMMFNGSRVIIAEPVNCKKEVKRTWKERLFTLPFNPFNKFKAVDILVDIMEDGQVVQQDNNLHMTIKTWHKLQKAMDNVGCD